MLQARAGLSPSDLEAIADLERRSVAADGGRLKLEWPTLGSRPTDRVSDLLWFDGPTLVGFVGLYQFGSSTIELGGAVDPAARRQGIGTALLEQALTLVAARGRDHALLVCPRTPAGGAAFAAARGATLEHSEFALSLPGDPVDGPSDPATTLRDARAEDAGIVQALITDGFGRSDPVEPASLVSARGRNIIVERDGEVVGYLATPLDDGVGGVYGFVIASPWRGRGIGGDVLRRVCRSLRAEGATRVGLEVLVENEHALGLYTSLGFEPVITEDYFRVTVPA